MSYKLLWVLHLLSIVHLRKFPVDRVLRLVFHRLTPLHFDVSSNANVRSCENCSIVTQNKTKQINKSSQTFTLKHHILGNTYSILICHQKSDQNIYKKQFLSFSSPACNGFLEIVISQTQNIMGCSTTPWPIYHTKIV